MSESAARAVRFDTSPSSPASYLWQIPGKPLAVRIRLELIERLEHEVGEKSRSLSFRGSEIGGVLLGGVSGGAPANVSIDAFELIPCDYSRGPLYRFSEADLARFRRAIELRRSSNGPRVVGFFRSHTRKGLNLDAEDVALFNELFREPHQVALLIRPYASKTSTAGIFIWENGSVQGDASYQEFPFCRSELEHGAGSESAGSSQEAPAPAATPAAPPEAPKPPARAQIVPIASRKETAIPPPAGRTAESKAPLAPEPRAHAIEKVPAAPSTKTPSAEKPAPEPKFGVGRAGSILAAAGAIASSILATAAEKAGGTEAPTPGTRRLSKVIWIAGGGAAGLLLLSGILVYPGIFHKSKRAAIAGPDAALYLRVERSQGELLLTWNRDSDAVRNAEHAVLTIVDGDQHADVNLELAQLQDGSIVYSPSSPDVSFQLSVIGKDSSKKQSESVRVLRTRPSPMPDNPPPSPKPTITTIRPEVTATTVTESAPLKPFVVETLAQRLRPERPSDLPDAPRLSSAEPAPIALPGASLTPPAPVGTPAPAQAAPAGSAPVKPGGQLQAAEIVSRTNLEYPLAARQARVQGAVVVLAVVGPDGRIKSASAISGPPMLQGPAVAAVKQWTYKPATLNGAPVESETRVKLDFSLGR